MAIVSLGDMAQSFALRRHNAQLKLDLQRQSVELSTGRVADLGKAVAGDYALLAGIERSLSRLDAFKTATAEADLFSGAMQTALSAIEDQSTTLAPQLLTASSSGQPAQVDAIGADAKAKLSAVLSALNGRLGDRTLFAGVATDGAAVADADTILAALGPAVAGATTAAEVATAVSAWFDDPSGYAAQGYLGADTPLSPLPIGEGESVQLEATANAPAIRDTLKGLAMAALLDQGVLSSSPDQRAALAKTAGETLLASESPRAGLQARLGIAQSRIEQAATRNSAEASSLNIAKSGIVTVDPYETATALQNTQNQIETLYSITARLSRLTLVDYLP